MVVVIVIVAAFLASRFFPRITCAVKNPIKVIRYGIKDLYGYIKYKRYNNVSTGEIIAYCGMFGRGKTLSVVHRIVTMYAKYNGKKVWCARRKCFVTQVVKVISNVDLKIPYEKFTDLRQIVYAAENNRVADDENNTLTVTLVLGDEFSTQLNSRSFKTNINAMLLNTILTCRHHNISLYYTAQRFGHVDALLRQVTGYVIQCRKLWRLQGVDTYDAWEMENATNPRLIRPQGRGCWFVTDKDYNAYDTMACVENLKKSYERNDMLSEKEILELQCNNSPNLEIVSNPSRELKKRRKKAG